MKTLLAVTPFLLIAALPLAACSKSDPDTNSATSNYELSNDEGAADANVSDSILNSESAPVDNSATDNATVPATNAQ